MGARGASRLPVYRVVKTGLETAEAERLAQAFKVPGEHLAERDGEVSFLDPAKYLAVPMVEIDDPEIVERCHATTTTHHPEIPIAVHGIDYEALDRHVPFAPHEALRTTAAALEAAGLIPDSARPIVGHSVFTTVAVDDDGNEQEQRRTLLDTHVNHRFTVDGYPLVGPGAQIQVSYGAEGNVTRLLHATRTLEPGPAVAIIDAETVTARLACALVDEAEIDLQLVYLAPSLHRAVNVAPDWCPSELIPWYAVKVTRQVIHPARGEAQPFASRIRLIPATDDHRYVPSVTIAATARDGSRVEGRAMASGGTPPYTFLWGGSNPAASVHHGDRVSYEPQTRDLRHVIPSQSFARTEHVTVTVVDANGVTAEAMTSLPVVARPAPDTHNSVTYGCESPNDLGAWTGDRIHWQQAMSAFGGGTERFCWLNDSSWPGDYIEPPKPGGTEAHPWINGDADYRNWGINTANIVFYIGDSNPEVFAEMYPGATPSDYNTAAGAWLWAPTNTNTVGIGSQSYAVPYVGNWGAPHPNDQLQWLAMYACNFLESDESAPAPWNRWGPAFNGLHSLLAFETEAGDDNDFCSNFPLYFLGFDFAGIVLIPPVTVVQAWMSAANAASIGSPAAMGPIRNITRRGVHFAVSDGDYYWGRGPVGPTIPRSEINGWWYIQGTGAVQTIP
jgi:Family of unknown function (DUF6345)